MDEARKSTFKNLTYEQKFNLSFEEFTASEVMEIINETLLKDEDKEMLVCRIIKCMTIEKIAEKFGYDIRTVTTHLKKSIHKLHLTCTKIF